MIQLGSGFILTLFLATHAFGADSFSGRLNSFLPSTARWGLMAVEQSTGKNVVAAGNAIHNLLIPASLVKLFTTGAALEAAQLQHAPDMTTRILHDGTVQDGVLKGNLYLVGGGNPFLSSDDLHKAADSVKGQGIRLVMGDIVADESRFDTKGLERTRTGAGYAPTGALGLHLHTVAVTIAPTEPGHPPLVTLEPENDLVRVALSARTADTSKETVQVSRIDDHSYRVSGNVPANSPARRWRFPVQDPALYAAEAFAVSLRNKGVAVRGGIRKSKAPETTKEVAAIPGPPLASFIGDTNVNSLNVASDNLLLALGAQKFGFPGTREKGVRAVEEHLVSLGLFPGEMTIVDGSGLLEGNRMSPQFMVRYLSAVATKPWFPTFQNSLPRAGMDGTLKNNGYRNELFRAKTGRLENSYGLAGFGRDGKGREIIFAYIVNVPDGAAPNLEQSGAEVMRFLAEMQ